MSIWPRSFLDPNSDRWRRKVEDGVDSANETASTARSNLISLSQAITGLRERVAAQFGNLQTGVSVIQGDGTTAIMTEVVFARPFSAPPAVIVSNAGYRVGYADATSGTSYASVEIWGHITAVNVTTDGFTIVMASSSTAYSTSNFYYANWIARSVG